MTAAAFVSVAHRCCSCNEELARSWSSVIGSSVRRPRTFPLQLRQHRTGELLPLIMLAPSELKLS